MIFLKIRKRIAAECERASPLSSGEVDSIATYAAGRWRPQAAGRAWRWCPVAWNELIWLPLPLAGKLLAILAKQDREECFKQIAFVVAERKLQRRVAVDAMIEIALDDLQANSMAEIADATERINWTRDASVGELLGDMTTTVLGLDRVAQHAGQCLTLHNAYRKGEALEHAVDELEALQLQLIATMGRFVPRLRETANQWRALLEAEREKLRKLTEGAREIPNPFVFGNPVMETEHNLFSGRKDIVRQIEACVLDTRQSPTLLLHGPRRTGKTSILYQLPRLLGPDFAPAVVDCQNPAVVESEVTLLRYLTRAFAEGLGLRRVYVQPLTAVALEREPFLAFDEWLDAAERQIPKRMRVLLCLDEYERLQATLVAGWGGRFLDALRHTLQHRPRLVLMFTGAHTFQELGPEWTDRFISARRVRLSFLTREDVELLLRKPIPKFDMTYASGALDAVIAATSCQPFLTQAVAFELVQLLNERQQKEATPDDVEEAIARALVSGGEYFANLWSEAGEQGQAILRAVTKGEVPPAFHAASAWLRDHDVLSNDGDFTVEMVRRWVKIKSL
jgi:DNA polymerase III delta prime subunit